MHNICGFFGLLHHVAWWLDTNVSGDHVASIFRVEMHGEWEEDIDTGRV
jgi:hypothetical protein